MLRGEPEAQLATDRRTRETWPDLCLVVVALIALLVGYRPLVDGSDWIVTTALVVLIVATAAVVLHLIGLHRLVTPVALLVEAVVLGWVFAPSTLLVVVPTPATVDRLLDLANLAGDIIVNEQAPVAAAQPVVLTLAAAFGALVIVADLLLRLRWTLATTGVLLLAVFVVPSMVTGTDASWWAFAVAAAVWLVLLRSRTAVEGPSRRARQAPAVLVGVGGLLAAGLFPVVTPDISAVATNWGRPPPQVFGRGINPMLELGSNLRRNNPVTVLTLSTELDDAPYLKVATLSDFTGRTWRPSRDLGFTRFEGQFFLDDDVDAEAKDTQIRIDQLRSELLPVPYPAVDVRGVDGGFRWERTGQTVVANDDDSRGQNYTVTSLDVNPTADKLRAADPRVPDDLAAYTELTAESRDGRAALDAISTRAEEVTAEADTNYDRAKALQDYLRGSEFEYSELAPVRDDFDGNGVEALATFLEVKAGYCVHFSSAMAVMARSLDIPARIAVGYAPGDRGAISDGEQSFTVRSDNLHAWTELYFEGVGWVRFDPTPTIGEATSFVEDAAPTDTGSDTGASGGTSQDQQDTGAVPSTPVPTETVSEDSTAGRSVVAVVAVLLVLLLAPLGVRRLRRWWRLRPRSGSPDAPWRELGDTATDLGLAPVRTETPRGFATRLRGRSGIDEPALARLLDDVEHARFARTPTPREDVVADARAVIASLTEASSTADRWRARLLPRSLAGRLAASPDAAPVTTAEA